MATEFQFGMDENVLEMDGSDGSATRRMNLMPLNCNFKGLQW